MENIRSAAARDASRLAEILVFAKRVRYRPIFRNDPVSFGELQVLPLAQAYRDDPARLAGVWVYDDGIVRGMARIDGPELAELYVDPFFQGKGVGGALLDFALAQGVRRLWVLERNDAAIAFYRARGFRPAGARRPEPGTPEYVMQLTYGPDAPPELPYRIRQAVPADYPAVRVLEEQLFARHRAARPDYFKPLETPYTREEFTALLALPSPIAWVAEAAGQAVGICFGRIEETSENSFCQSRRIAFLEDLAVLPAYRGRGIAAALLRRAEDQGREAGAVSLELRLWPFNEAAARLYARAGLRVQYYRMEEALCP